MLPIIAHGATPHITTRTFLLAWEPDPLIAVPLLLALVCYVVGWRRLNRAGFTRLATRPRLASYVAGQIVLGTALMSGIDTYQSALFSIHMIQHELLMMIVPPLIWWGSPLPVVLWGMPRPLRLALARMLTRRSRFRQGLTWVGAPLPAALIYVLTVWLWHAPGAYDAALRNDLVHYAEHLNFFLAAMLFWWHITGAFPRLHSRASYGVRLAMAILALISNQALAFLITLSEGVIYRHYLSVERISHMTAYDDQALGGMIMWVPGGMMYLLIIAWLIWRMIDAGQPRRPEVRGERQRAG